MPSTSQQNTLPCFFYGSLMEPKVLNAVTRPGPDSDLFTVRATIKGYTRFTYHNQPYPGMIPSQDPEEVVEGLLVFGHSDLERQRLDQFEGSEYPRATLKSAVKIHGPVPARYTVDREHDYEAETKLDAFVYVFKGPIEHLDLNRPWDYEAFKREHVADWMTDCPTFKTMLPRITMVNDIYSKTKDTLSPQKALEKARFFLDIAATTDDPVIKLMLSGNVGSILSKIEKSARKALVSSPTVDAQVLCDGIIAAFTKNGTLFSELGHQSDAKASFKSADKWQYDHSISHAASSSTPLKRKQARTDEAVLPPEIFPQDVPRPVLKHDLPKPDGRLVNTPQLAYCLGLLSMAQTFSPSDPEFDEPLDGTQRAWVDATLKNEDEQERLRSLVTKLMEAFINNGLKDDATVAEVMCLAPILEQGQYRNLLDTLVGGIKQSTVLDFSLLEGLILMIQSASPGYLRTEDLVKILSILGSRLEGTHHQSTEYLYQLAKAMSSVLDAMADSGVKDVNREELHAPLTAYLEELNSCSDLSLKYQAAYACQALQHVPDDEKLWQSALRRTRVVVSGVSKMATAVKNVELERFIEGLKNIHEGFEGAYKAAKTTGKTVASVVGLFESRHGLVGNLREGFPFSRKQTWYTALRGADTLLGDGQLREFRNLICRSPCRQEPEFVWGLSQRLGEIATNSLWDDNTRQQAIEFLSELYTNDTEWGQQPEVKQWILTILIQISILQDAVVQNQAHIVLQNLKTNGDAKRRALYQDSINHLPTPYKIKICLPLPSSPTLLDHVQDIPDIEADLRKLRARQLSGRGKTVYIPPQSKASPQALDESRFPLMEKVLDFLKSDRQVLLIQGDSGAGKSTFNRKLECDLWESYRKADGRIPLHIHLPEIKESNQDLITKHLRRTDFTERQIRELKCRREFILICDGYDESQQSHNLYTSNRLNEPGQWRVKMIISCRSEYLEQNYYDRFQPTDRNHRGLSTLFQEAVILPFSAEQIEDYIKQYVCQNQLQWTTDSYMEVLRMVPSLMDLVKNPFLLSLSLETLPSFVDENQIKDLSGANITRVGLYDKFVEQWLERGKKRRMEMDLNPQTKAIFDTLVDEGFAKTGIDFIKRLAAAMFKEQGGHPVVDYSRSQDKGTWKAEFFSREDESQILREASPLARSGNQFRILLYSQYL
ncbi:hypothetical protein BGX28_006284 [Mortierella sp. GBA30]|nr:hypothetical protein BGX28_006284 [Mortierella sp. GBA30]